jgi:hypothetical protein
MNKSIGPFFIFFGWLILILATAPLSGVIYFKFMDPGLVVINSSGLVSYVDGVLASYISITIIFCFIFIKKLRNKYIVALILTLPMLLLDLWASDGPKLLLDVANIAIFLIVGQLIVLFFQKNKAIKK